LISIRHQIEAALFAFRNPFSRGAILADEAGLRKTIEAGLLLAQRSSWLQLSMRHGGSSKKAAFGLQAITSWSRRATSLEGTSSIRSAGLEKIRLRFRVGQGGRILTVLAGCNEVD
jgi:hypothetical protein